ncbi:MULTISPECIES: hypothetical protein [unclassified Rhodococcus (in: high G+C Gram-positive bacteria)]|uniref:hypothetical protein n=1 Tax=unclassified Rhodococcus (in: high G+C Gram-positive bacteria) TaxID=192944 RepID=UPI0011403B46|nr:MULTISPECIES: hypothetical protein [unclassified Rhodococcus (in: high G+C Gram-positive bacteria)]
MNVEAPIRQSSGYVLNPPSIDFEEPELLTLKLAAAHVGRTEVVLRKWISRGLLKPVVTRQPWGHLVNLYDVERIAQATRHRKGLHS